MGLSIYLVTLFSKAEAHPNVLFVCRALAAAVSLAHNRREAILMVLRYKDKKTGERDIRRCQIV